MKDEAGENAGKLAAAQRVLQIESDAIRGWSSGSMSDSRARWR